MDNQPGQEINQMAQPDPTVRAQDMMLRMAANMRDQGHVHEAIDMYMRLLDEYPDTQASRAASNALVDMAQYLEQHGMPHTALEVLQKLEQYQ